MNTLRTIITLSSLAFLSACGGAGENATVPQAEPAGVSHVDIGTHTVHFSAQLTDQLPPEIARTYSIVRSKNRALLNISIIKKAEGTPGIRDVHSNPGRERSRESLDVARAENVFANRLPSSKS